MKLLLSIIFVLTFLLSYSQTVRRTTININYDSLKDVLEKMSYEEQNIRRILLDSIGIDSPNAGPFKLKMREIDNSNKINIENILNKYGWIERSKIGTKAADAIFLIIQHSDLELMDKYYSEFKNLAERDEANPRQCAMMEDRLLMWKGKKQTYGTQANNTFRTDKKMAIWPIEDFINVNERRKMIGFKSTVEEQAKSMNVIYDPNDTLPEKN
jgi:hypothetical protein